MGWFHGLKPRFICNGQGEILSFFPPGNTGDRDARMFEVLKGKLFGKLYAGKGYVSQNLFEMLSNQGIHIVTGLESNMKKCLMPPFDKMMLRKRSLIETVNDELIRFERTWGKQQLALFF